MHALPTAIPIAKQQKKNYILHTLLLFTNYNKQRYGKAEQQSFRAAEVCTRPPLDEAPLHYCPMPPLDEAPLHSCSMPPFGRGPSTLLLHASIWTRPFYTTAPCPLPDQAPLQELFCSRPSLLQNQQLYMLKRHCKQTVITYQHMKLSCNIQLEL